MRLLSILLAAMLVAAPARAQAPAADPAASARAALAANTRLFSMSGGRLEGPGADFLLARAGEAQFVLLGETHFDRDIPRFAGALFAGLRAAHGFGYLAVEQDPLAIDAVNDEDHRGDVAAISALARRYPTHIGFASDQDLALLAEASRASTAGDPVVWGLEQAQGATRYLEELERLAPTPAIRAETGALLALARTRETRATPGAFLHDDPAILPRLEALQAAFAARPGSRADELLTGLATSARIYSYNRRANAGEWVGLYNNTEREALFKAGFMRRYREAARGGRTPKVMFKFGNWHMYRGLSPGGAYTIGNFAHEFAIANGGEAYGIDVAPLGDGYVQASDYPAWMAPLLPAEPPAGPVVVDLRPLKPIWRDFAAVLDPGDRAALRAYIQGFDALVVLPRSAKASWALTGFSPP
jgi:hypothetical protein